MVEKLVEVVHYLHVEIDNAFGPSGYFHTAQISHAEEPVKLYFLLTLSLGAFVDGGVVVNAEPTVSCQRLGPAGLALHYANIIIQIYSIVSFSLFIRSQARPKSELFT